MHQFRSASGAYGSVDIRCRSIGMVKRVKSFIGRVDAQTNTPVILHRMLLKGRLLAGPLHI